MSLTIDINKTIAEAEHLLEHDTQSSPALKATMKMLLVIVSMLTDRLNLNSRNSSKPPSSDPNRPNRTKTKTPTKPGGQNGHTGSMLAPVDDPDQVHSLRINRRRLPAGQYQDGGLERRQVFDIRISRFVTEYQAQVLIDAHGRRFVAEFPEGVTRPAQYGASVKAHSVYLSQWQLIPYERVQRQFRQLYDLPISAGSVFNFNLEAAERLGPFLTATAQQLANRESVLHADETSFNLNGKRHWLHTLCNERWTLIQAHPNRGKQAMDDIGVLPLFDGTLIHDHWKPYYRFDGCVHGLCNAHHKRELTYAYEQDSQFWAQQMHELLDQLNAAVKAADGALTEPAQQRWRRRYRQILKRADQQCPPPAIDPQRKRRGRVPKSKSRNLLERLRDYEEDVLRFMTDKAVPFTNNQAERDIRMTKVQQKVSGCFRSKQGVDGFCAVRSYLSTCQKHRLYPAEALEHLFKRSWPDFIRKAIPGF